MIATLEPCKAGFDGCDAMRAQAVAKHPRTPRLAECRHYPIPPENPDRLQGPEVGTLCLYQGRNDPSPAVVRVVERSYVWSPGDHSQSRRYDLKVIARGPNRTRTLLVDDKDLVPLTADEALTAGGGPLTEGMVLA
jgi:hypothetical protein